MLFKTISLLSRIGMKINVYDLGMKKRNIGCFEISLNNNLLEFPWGLFF